MNAKTRTKEDKLRERRSLCWAFLVISAFFLYMLPKELLMDTLAFLQTRGLERGLQILWVRSRGQVIGLAIFAGLALLNLSCLLGIPSLTLRIAREKEKTPANIPPQSSVTEKGGVPMRNNKKNQQPLTKGTATIIGVIVAAIMVFAGAGDGDALIPAVATMVIVSAILIITTVANKKKANKDGARKQMVELNRPFPTPKTGKQTAAILRHSDEAEEAISCQHLTGKEKYIQQLDSYLKAGLIDKAEYKIMKDRYSKLEIPEDYH
jgi:hypothetical protein